ncbi:hypothetical protein C0J52_26330 [Blattella germanica]|nr:hypothetical protein C0J52_26330 [Blattella germanica]
MMMFRSDNRLINSENEDEIAPQVLTWCEMSKVAAVVYVCFAHSFEVDSRSVNLFSEIVSKLPFRLLKDKPNFTCRYSGPEVASNLYM